HTGDVGPNLEAVGAELVAQVTGDTVEERIAAGDDDHALLAQVRFERLHDVRQVSADRQTLGAEFWHERKRGLGAEKKFRRLQQFARPAREAGEAVAADA